VNNNLKKNILIVDDEKSNIDIILDFFKKIDIDKRYNIIATRSGKKVLEVVKKRKIDLILLDIMMPDMDGYEVCKILKLDNKTKNIPIIFITASTDENSIEKAFNFGGVDYISKPFRSQELLARVSTQLNIVEQSDIKNKLMQEQAKMASMGMMIENIAHQWRQPLSQVNSAVFLIDYEINSANTSNNKVIEKLDEIERMTKYMSNTIDDFRHFFDKNRDKEEFYIKDSLLNSISIIKDSLKQNKIKIELDIDNDITIDGYINELQQVILIVLNNAKDAFTAHHIENAKILIATKRLEKNMEISICDNAGGISEEIIDKIFGLYFTTKFKTKGSGLGLSIAKSIIEEHFYGSLSIVNSEDGACFKIILPLIDSNKSSI